MSSLRIYGFMVLFLFFAYPQVTSSSPLIGADSSVIAVNLSVAEWLEDYMKWVKSHPEVMRSYTSTSTPKPLMLGMPYLELFSPTGISLYRGSNSDENAAFLHDLTRAIPSRGSLTANDELRPTLKEYFEMLAELRPYASKVLTGRQFIVLAVTYPDKAFCKAQNDALSQLKSDTNIRVVEVRLHI